MGKKLSGKDLLDLAAERSRILPEYVDTEGHLQKINPETRVKILNAMGLPTGSARSLRGALERDEYAFWSQLSDPVLVVRTGNIPKYIHFRIPIDDLVTDFKGLRLKITIENEAGGTSCFRYDHNELVLIEKKALRTKTFGCFGAPFPADLPLGYYTFQITATAGQKKKDQAVRVIVCPERTYLPPVLQGDRRLAGIWVPLYAIRSDRNWGIGDFADLKRFALWASRELKVAFIGINPLHSLFNRSPYNISPYLPASRLYRNFIYLDIFGLADFKTSKKAEKFLSERENRQLVLKLRALKEVDYEKVAALKGKVLRLIFEDFIEENWSESGPVTERAAELEGYIKREGRFLDDYATFMTLEREWHLRDHRIWTWKDWPQQYHDPESEAVEAFKKKHWKDVLFHKYLQWQIDEQLRELNLYLEHIGIPLGLYHDLAMADDLYGADYWANQDLFVSGIDVGAPPDDFSPKGQNWGFPPPDLEKVREDGYRFFIHELKRNCCFGGCLRIDHIMRLFHQFWIPHGMDPKDGAYVATPHEELMGILALESVRNKVLIVGEDLGTVQPFIRKSLEGNGVFSYRLIYFEKDSENEFLPPSVYPSFALASITTHDLPTLCGFWQGLDIEERRRLRLFPDDESFLRAVRDREQDKRKLLKALIENRLMPPHSSSNVRDYPELTEELQDAFIGFLAMCRSKLIMLNQEDLFRDPRQQNMPGTTWERKNWVARMRFNIEDLFESLEVAQFARIYRHWILKTNRAPEAD